MNLKTIFSLALFFIFALQINAFAHPGRTAADGCHYCRTNCDYWGVPWYQRHCHGTTRHDEYSAMVYSESGEITQDEELDETEV
jgi:hypothetical protein